MSADENRPLRFDVLTLFPEVFEPFLRASMPGIARQKGLVSYHLHDIREYSLEKHHKVDDRPYGGGPGMVLRCGPVFRCYEAVRAMAEPAGRLIMLTPQGKRFNQDMARDLSRSQRALLLCGHYEGFDERIRQGLPVEEVSVGDYVLSGGEAAAMVVLDATVRLVPGVLGHEDATSLDSFAEGLLEHPQYTRPPEFRGMSVPEVLLSGDHARIQQWRRRLAEERTRARRADLLQHESEETETSDEQTE
ncbi:MAG: tRNA (guanosine(37)-N1)-methyltransferase TrmD [Planctomycetes bacterium]|nr:tRNA (guanosine(37)-N1)-methyltransferase TrmD [Planctomycetota bacterium]